MLLSVVILLLSLSFRAKRGIRFSCSLTPWPLTLPYFNSVSFCVASCPASLFGLSFLICS